MTSPRIAGTSALFLGTFLAATGYGATFLLTRHLAAMGGSPADVGAILFAAMLGTFVGVPIVGWEAGRLGAAPCQRRGPH
ncbi:hypothetical protein RM543_12140 [Roseicyclus sp. F158]|uniref:Major facilitator superfamily (MFS) profile domain-containing protein n=1 Tax=Tropicimonas omnivorans TaxID=3075590 RepID=A0ABU3DI99_9RHOB|nr:hypothetical protein [Roseicyclus sp. F158]MDT0683439.1 hypothetical protein [Roseicyclus sp. F158]